MAERPTVHVWVNALTASRLALAVVVAALVPWARAETWAIVLATVLVAGIEATDLADGTVARRLGAVSTFGKLFDPYSDSISRLTVYWSLAVMGRCLAIVPLLMAIRDVTVGYTRIMMMRSGRDVAARWAGKLKALVQGVGALILMAGPLYWGESGPALTLGVSVAVAVVTVGSIAVYGWDAIKPEPAETQ